MDPGVWPGVEDRVEAQVADLDHVVVGDHEVVAGQHLGVVGGDPDVDPGVAQASTAWMWSQWPCVVSTRRTPVARHTSSSSSCSLAASMMHGLAGARAAHDEHVVLERSDDELVDRTPASS